MSAAATSPAAPSLADRLSRVTVGTREDLEVSRHVFGGEIAYVITDPVSFRSHRISAADYQAFTAIREDETLGSTFDLMIATGEASPQDEEAFYRFILELHGLGLLNLPVSNHEILYERFVRQQAATRKRRWMIALYHRIPLINPDRFLVRTLPLVRPLFSRAFIAAWTAVLLLAVFVIVARWGEVMESVSGVFRVESLAMTWFVLIGLKVVHEFGHAYACRMRGGAVPEMGAFLILMTPCAYMDASAAWAFTRRRDRLAVNLGGMYFESFIAVPALLAWAMMEPSGLREVMFVIALTASVTTVGFNINPLMRFDGYYALSDALGIPNLQARAFARLKALSRRWILGLRPETRDDQDDHEAPDEGSSGILITYGLCSILYKVTLLVGISSLIAMRLGSPGLILGAAYLGLSVFGVSWRLLRWLVSSPDTQPVRGRAIAVALAVFVAAPALAMSLPLPTDVRTQGLVETERTEIIRAPRAGTLAEATVHSGAMVSAGATLARLEDPMLAAAIETAEARLAAAAIRVRLAETDSTRPAAAAQARTMHQHAARVLADARQDLDRMVITAAGPGTVTRTLGSRSLGRWVDRGEPVAIVASGDPVVRVLLAAHELLAMDAGVGDAVSVRLRGSAETARSGTIVAVAAAGDRAIDQAALTSAGGGRIAVDRQAGLAQQAFYEVTVRFDGVPPAGRLGGTATVRLPGEPTTLARSMYRRMRAFVDRIAAG